MLQFHLNWELYIKHWFSFRLGTFLNLLLIWNSQTFFISPVAVQSFISVNYTLLTLGNFGYRLSQEYKHLLLYWTGHIEFEKNHLWMFLFTNNDVVINPSPPPTVKHYFSNLSTNSTNYPSHLCSFLKSFKVLNHSKQGTRFYHRQLVCMYASQKWPLVLMARVGTSFQADILNFTSWQTCPFIPTVYFQQKSWCSLHKLYKMRRHVTAFFWCWSSISVAWYWSIKSNFTLLCWLF